MQRLDLATTPATPWKNGGGATRELVRWPPGSALDDFGWRVSVATLASSGAFSVFAGVDRHLLLLQGQGVRLHSSDGRVDHTLHRPWEPVAFAGDVPVHCILTAGAAEDFNLMLRRGQWRGSLQVLRTACALCDEGEGLIGWQHLGDDVCEELAQAAAAPGVAHGRGAIELLEDLLLRRAGPRRRGGPSRTRRGRRRGRRRCWSGRGASGST